MLMLRLLSGASAPQGGANTQAGGRQSPSPRRETGVYAVRLMDHSIILNRRLNQELFEQCILGSGNAAVQSRLRRFGREIMAGISFERLPMPDFGPSLSENAPNDRFNVVRGQVVLPWCVSPDFLWITAIRPLRPLR